MSARDEERNLIVMLHEFTGGCPKFAREIVQDVQGSYIGKDRVPRVWAEEGLQKNKQGGCRSGVSRESFLHAYGMFERDFQKIQNHLERTPEQLINLGYKHNVKFLNRPAIPSDSPKKRIGYLYGRFNTNGKQINTREQTSFIN